MDLSKFTKEEIETLKYFLFIVVRRLYNEKDFLGFPNINFVIDNKIVDELAKTIAFNNNYSTIKVTEDKEEYVFPNDIEETKKILMNNQRLYKEYQGNGLIDDNTYYLPINNIEEFVKLLTNIILYAKDKYYPNYEYSLLYSMWLRLSPNDLGDINSFVRKQLDFIMNDNYLKYHSGERYNKWTNFGYDHSYRLQYNISSNNPLFETNRRIIFALTNNQEMFVFPMIHYALNYENNKMVCYIYGIQDNENFRHSEEIEKELVDTKKGLRNKYVKYTFIMALQYFIKVLNKYHINTIKVPLLQVLNYPYHQNLSVMTMKSFMEKYSPLEIERINKLVDDGLINDEVIKFQTDYKWYKNVVNKANIISKNKTERLVETFIALSDHQNIEFLNDPFIEDENISILIKK